MSVDRNVARDLDPFERQSLAKINLGVIAPMVMLLAFDPQTAPSEVFLKSRIQDLQLRVQMLQAYVVGQRTRSPRWEMPSEPWPSDSILQVHSYSPVDDADMEQENLGMEAVQLTTPTYADCLRPHWQVIVFKPKTARKNPISRTYVAVTANHDLMDALGLLHLAKLVVSESIDKQAFESFSTSYGPLYAARPGIWDMAEALFQHIVLPVLPSRLRGYFTPQRCWPEGPALTPLVVARPRSITRHFSTDFVRRLSSCGKQRKVTITTMINLAYCVAIWSIYRNIVDHPLVMRTVTAKSLRNEPDCKTRFLGTWVTLLRSDLLLKPEDDFFEVAIRLRSELNDPRATESARRAGNKLGLISWLPEPPPTSEKAPLAPTQWEAFFKPLFLGYPTCNASIYVSNVGFVSLEELGGCSDIHWAGVKNTSDTPITSMIIGSKNGLKVSTHFREGMYLTLDQVEEIVRVFVGVLERLVLGDGGNIESLTKEL